MSEQAYPIANDLSKAASALGGVNPRQPTVLALVPPAGYDAPVDAALILGYGFSLQLGISALVVDTRTAATATSVGRGFSDVLRDELPLDGLVQRIDLGLDFLPAGGAAPLEPSRVWTALTRFLARIGSAYGAVILLTDPVVGSITARMAARAAHKALLLAREDVTPMQDIRRSREILLDSLVTEIEVVFDRPATTWKERCFGPIKAFARGLGRKFTRAGSSLRRQSSPAAEAPGNEDPVATKPGNWMPRNADGSGRS